MKQVVYQDKLARVRQKKLLWGDFNFWGGIGISIVGVILCFKTDLLGSHSYLGWGVFLIIGGVICMVIGRHYISTCDEEYMRILREIDDESKKGA